MKVDFAYRWSDDVYDIMVTNIINPALMDHDGNLFTKIIDPLETSEQIIGELFLQLSHRHIVTKKVAVILNLLVNPYFDETCEYVKTHYSELPKNVKRFLRKNIYSFLTDEFRRKIWSMGLSVGSVIYHDKCMYEKSKEMLKLLSQQ